MQIFTRQGVYDSRVVNKMKQCQYKNAPSYLMNHIDNAPLTLDSITIFCVPRKLSHYIQRGGE